MKEKTSAFQSVQEGFTPSTIELISGKEDESR